MAKVLLVTGGSRGIGAAICRLGARDGYDVAVNFAGRAEAVLWLLSDKASYVTATLFNVSGGR